jgi:hypothetical protein
MDAVYPTYQTFGSPGIGQRGCRPAEPAYGGDTFTGPQARRQPPTYGLNDALV